MQPGRLRARHEGDEGPDEQEAKCDEDERGHSIEATLDDDEVRPPDHHDQHGEEDMAAGHAPIVGRTTMKIKRRSAQRNR